MEPIISNQLLYTPNPNFLDYKQFLNLDDLEDSIDGEDDDDDEIGTEESPYTSNASLSDYLDQYQSGASRSDSSSGGNLSMDESIGG